MNKFFITCLLFLFSLTMNAQILKGRVLDANTKEPIVFANVYFNGTFRGTTTDTLGYFNLRLMQKQHLSISVSYVGYYSKEFSNYSTSKELIVLLRPKTFDLEAVIITIGKNKRKQKERAFKRDFLGSSRLANYCIIENLNDIELTYSKDKKILYAKSKQPIRINNTYLGYRIEYYLDFFYSKRDTVFFQGSYYFKEKESTTPETLIRYIKNRKSAYLGSKMHFIRTLYNNNLKKEGYKILGSNRYKYSYDSIMTHKSSHYINIRDHIKISYRGFQESALYQLNDSIYISNNGFSNPFGILWAGYMGQQRLCDLLPFEYQPERE